MARLHLPRGEDADANHVGSPEAMRESQEALLNGLGKDGWLLIQTDGRIFYFKRPVR